MEVAGLLGNRASQLGTLASQMGNRAGLLATGSPTAALSAISATTQPASMLPDDSDRRETWIVRNVEARDLVVFAASEAYVQARRQLGLGSG
jgi:hypothetical protein